MNAFDRKIPKEYSRDVLRMSIPCIAERISGSRRKGRGIYPVLCVGMGHIRYVGCNASGSAYDDAVRIYPLQARKMEIY